MIGGTLVFEESHKWGTAVPPRNIQPKAVEMKAGSVVVFLSTLVHGGGANVSNTNRLAITFQYCEPYIRPQENMMLSVPFKVAREELSPKMRSLLGYSIHPPFVGFVDGIHPLKTLSKL